jgi:dTDP-4-amino-4,6-dideoxy-D-galactose acyltransferase
MRKLKWDSEFWGFDIINIDEDDEFYYNGSIDWSLCTNSYFLVQALIEDSKIQQINFLEDKGFRFVESKVTLLKPVGKLIEIEEDNFSQVKETDLLPYINEFYNMYGDISRFNLFPEDKVNDFYYRWVVNSISGTMDDKCVGYYVANKLAGFITYKFRGNEAKVGLVGVFSDYRNRGISQRLLNYLYSDAAKVGLSQISISTQGKNLYAMNSYIKNGFFFNSIKHWYYYIGGRQ